jgi:hypothetical protein
MEMVHDFGATTGVTSGKSPSKGVKYEVHM